MDAKEGTPCPPCLRAALVSESEEEAMSYLALPDWYLSDIKVDESGKKTWCLFKIVLCFERTKSPCMEENLKF